MLGTANETVRLNTITPLYTTVPTFTSSQVGFFSYSVTVISSFIPAAGPANKSYYSFILPVVGVWEITYKLVIGPFGNTAQGAYIEAYISTTLNDGTGVLPGHNSVIGLPTTNLSNYITTSHTNYYSNNSAGRIMYLNITPVGTNGGTNINGNSSIIIMRIA